MAEARSTQSERNAAAAAEIPHHEPPVKQDRARKLYLGAGIAAAALVLIWLVMHFLGANKESTDDAQVAADVVPIAARTAGQVVAIHITENQAVKAGQLIAEIDPRDATVKLAQAQSDLETARAQAADADARIAVTSANARGGLTAAQAAVQSSRESADSTSGMIAEAQASVSRASANAEKARLDWERANELGGKGDISKAQVDAARAAHEATDADLRLANARLSQAQNARQAAQANIQQAQGKLTQSSPVEAQVSAARAQADLAHAKIKSAEAAVAAAQLTLSYTRIVAPSDGVASKLGVHVGSIVAPGQPIVTLVPPKSYVIANFKETQMSDIRVGDKAEVKIDMLGRRTFEGRVESLSGATGASFSLLPPDNASGNFIKVVQRVPVRIAWTAPEGGVPVGSSAEVTVFTK